MNSKHFVIAVFSALSILALTSCGSHKSLIVPHAVSTVNSIPTAALNLQKGDYEILNTVTETASITAKYAGWQLKITSGDGDFSYTFRFDKKTGWNLHSFSDTANFGYLMTDMNQTIEMPDAEEFARRVAIARLIDSVKDYGADGVLEPIVTTRANNSGRNTVEYTAIVSAKIIKIHPTDGK